MGAAATERKTAMTSDSRTHRGGVLITGAGGEVGHGLIHALAGGGGLPRLYATDLRELEPALRERCEAAEAFDIRDDAEIARVLAAGDIDTVYHLAALLSTSSEKNPELAFDVNVGGTMALLKRCAERAVKTGRPIRVVYPSTIAVYGMPDLAAKGKPYVCFVREDARIPFMTMPSAIRATLRLAGAPRESLKRHVYNISAFAPSAGEFASLVREFFPQARVSYEPHPLRQGIVDSWPADIDCAAASRDWGFDPGETLRSAFENDLIPAVKKRYGA